MSNEQRYYDALRAIARDYMTPDQMRREARNVGLSQAEYIEAAYENIQGLAERAIKGKRRPKDATPAIVAKHGAPSAD